MTRLTLLYATPDGEIGEAPALRPLDLDGGLIAASDLIPMPAGTTVAMMPGRLAVGRDRHGQRVTLPGERGWAISAFLPIGYTRTRIPGYDLAPPELTPPQAETLPFFGYTALVSRDGELCVTALATDDPERWHPDAYAEPELAKLVRRRLASEPENRVLRQHAHCALDYHCPTASNLFFGRWEGAIAVAGAATPAASAASRNRTKTSWSPRRTACYSCPTQTRSIDVAVRHLEQSPDAIISFRPGLRGRAADCRRGSSSARSAQIRAQHGEWHDQHQHQRQQSPRAPAPIRRRTRQLARQHHLRRPRDLRRLLSPDRLHVRSRQARLTGAGPRGWRATPRSTCSLSRSRPTRRMRSPRWSTMPARRALRLVQLRNLNIDPEVLLPQLPPRGPALGIQAFINLLRRELPDLRIGNFSVPVIRNADGKREPMFAPWEQRSPVTSPAAPRL